MQSPESLHEARPVRIEPDTASVAETSTPVQMDSGPEGSFLVALGWGIGGFLVGAVFWHFIGFWGFVSNVVLRGASSDEFRYVEQAGGNCAVLALDRESGRVNAAPCVADADALPEQSRGRGDFAGIRAGLRLAPERWSVSISGLDGQ